MPRQIGVVITEVPLIDLDPDDEPSPPRGTPPPTAPVPTSPPVPVLPSPVPSSPSRVPSAHASPVPHLPSPIRTPTRLPYPTSDDEEYAYEPTTPPFRTGSVSPHPSPRRPPPYRTQPRMSVRPPLRYPLAVRDYPRTTYEHGESSRQAEYRARTGYCPYPECPYPAPVPAYPPPIRPPHPPPPVPPVEPPINAETRGRLDSAMTTMGEIQGTLRGVVEQMQALSMETTAWKAIFERRLEDYSEGELRHYGDGMRRLWGLQSLVYGVICMAVLAVIIAALPYFLPWR